MNDHGKSDRLIVPKKSSNNAGSPVAEEMEGRSLAKGNTDQQNTPRTQSRLARVPSALDRVRQLARKDRKVRVTALLHHVNLDRLRDAFMALRRNAAPGVDGETWEHYAEEKTADLADLAETKVGKDGRILEWSLPFEEESPGHRHVSHLYGLHPGEEIHGAGRRCRLFSQRWTT